jgi:nucleoside-diphosphate kinase
MEKTLTIIKPDGVKKNVIGDVIKRYEENGLKVIAMKMIHQTKEEARGFYIVHKERPFYDSLTDFMSEGPVVIIVLKGENAISKVREIMGATNPEEADAGTIRADHAENIERNTVHGSDSPESADYEINYYFSELEIVG